MVQNGEQTTAMDLIYLMSCAVNEKKPSSERCAKMDLEAVLKFAKLHLLSATAAYALEKTVPLPTEWQDAKAASIRKTIIFNSERAKVLQALDENGIWYLPLKGCILKDYYPKAAMREMADNDILCDGNRMSDVKKIMLILGYRCVEFGRSKHDVYHKKNMNFEMHKTLFNPVISPAFASYFENIKDRLIKDEGNQFGYHLKDEDFYIHSLCHMYFHYNDAGIGLRALLDVYVMNKKKRQLMDWDYIRRELERLELNSFEQEVRSLADRTFSLEPLSPEEQKQLTILINSTCFGLYSSYLAKRMAHIDSRAAKRKYIFRRFFPDSNYLRINYPTVYRYKILYPFLLVFRLFHGLIIRRKRLIQEYKMLKQCQTQDSSAVS